MARLRQLYVPILSPRPREKTWSVSRLSELYTYQPYPPGPGGRPSLWAESGVLYVATLSSRPREKTWSVARVRELYTYQFYPPGPGRRPGLWPESGSYIRTNPIPPAPGEDLVCGQSQGVRYVGPPSPRHQAEGVHHLDLSAVRVQPEVYDWGAIERHHTDPGTPAGETQSHHYCTHEPQSRTEQGVVVHRGVQEEGDVVPSSACWGRGQNRGDRVIGKIVFCQVKSRSVISSLQNRS